MIFTFTWLCLHLIIIFIITWSLLIHYIVIYIYLVLAYTLY